MSEELEPCPWCKSQPGIHKTKYGFEVFCNAQECLMKPATPVIRTVRKVISIWNNRKGESE